MTVSAASSWAKNSRCARPSRRHQLRYARVPGLSPLGHARASGVHERKRVRVLVIVSLGVVLVRAEGAVGKVPGNAVRPGTEHKRLAAAPDELWVAPALD